MIQLVLVLSFIGSIIIGESQPWSGSKEDIAYWHETDLSFEDIDLFLDEASCHDDFKACLFALKVGLNQVDRDLDPQTGKVISYKFRTTEREFSEKLDHYQGPDPIKLLDQIIARIDKDSEKVFTAQTINGYLSYTVDPHSHIEPVNHGYDPPKEEKKLAPTGIAQALTETRLDPVTTYSDGDVSLDVEEHTIRLRQFSPKVCGKVKTAIELVNRLGWTNLFFDLRYNPGGYIREAACIASLFTGKVYVVNLKNFNGKDNYVYGTENQLYRGDITVLVNYASISSSELLAGFLQKENRAIIQGEITFGKGVFQDMTSEDLRIATMENVVYFKTSGYYFFKDQTNPHRVGIIPDVLVNYSDPDEIFREDESFHNSLPRLKYLESNFLYEFLEKIP